MTSLNLLVYLGALIISVKGFCSFGCVSCETSTTCFECDVGFFLVNSSFCAPCPSECATCRPDANGQAICDTCVPDANMGLNSNCFFCDPSCLTCEGSSKNCVSCRPGKELTITATCGNILGCDIQNCASCVSIDELGTMECEQCLDGYFSYRRNCFACKHPCNICSLDTVQLWTLVVTPGVVKEIREAYNATQFVPPPGFFPEVVNDLDFSGMNDSLKRGWTQAFFIYQLIKSTIPTSIQKDIPAHIGFFTQNKDKSEDELWNLILNRINGIVSKSWTMTDFVTKIGQIASSYTACTQCGAGFQLSSTPNVQCERCTIGCSLCAAGACTKCSEGFYLNAGLCQACTPPCANCYGSPTICTSCILPTTFAGGNCVVCVDPCSTCLSTNISSCITCKTGFSLNADSTGTCYRCDQDICLTCDASDSSLCYKCREGASLVSGKCQLCPGSCSTCAYTGTTAVCFSCIKGFQFVSADSSCVACASGCVSCSSGSCIQCLPGLFLSLQNGTCLKCKLGCKICSSYEVCTQYENGVAIINGKLVTCRPGCKTCDIPETCVECSDRYFKTADSICRPCEIGCLKCSSPTTCTVCAANLILSGGDCSPCLGGCKTCNNANLSQCLTCKRGYTLNGTSCVQQCNKGCLECDPANANNCLKCQQGHALRANGGCAKCPGTCSGYCDPNNITSCIGCLDGFELMGNKCIRCPAGCATCLNGQCSLCVPGFNIQQKGTSFICLQKCRPPCSSCNGSTCLSCQAGFLLINGLCSADISCNPICQFCPSGTEKNSTGYCVRCPTNCSTCINSICFECIPGLYLNSSSICAPCPQKCKTCFSETSCGECSAGYVKEISEMTSTITDATFSDKCIACDDNCKTCIVEPSRCTSCFEGMRLKSYRCAGVFTVVYEYHLDNPYGYFLQNAEADLFTKIICDQLGLSTQDNYIDYVKAGSTIIGGTLSATNQTQAENIQSSLNGTVPGYVVLSSTTTLYYGDSPYVVENEVKKAEQTTVNIGIIVGVSVGVVVLVGFIGFLIFKFKCKRAVDLSQVTPVNNEVVKQAPNSAQKLQPIKAHENSLVEFSMR